MNSGRSNYFALFADGGVTMVAAFLMRPGAEGIEKTEGGGDIRRRATHMGNTLVQLHRLHFCA